MKYPGYSKTPAQAVRATIDNGMTHAHDAAADVITAVANSLADAAAMEHPRSHEWLEGATEGAARAFAAILGRMLHEMPLPRLQEFLEDIADEVAPIREGGADHKSPF